MSLLSWLQNLRSALTPGRVERHRGRRDALRARAHRPNLEVLEGRCVPASSVWADFNGDALLDLATANYLSNDVSIFLGNSDGSFQPAQNYPTYADGGPTCIAAGDFNGDGNLDLVTGNSDASISLLLGNGDGSFWLNSSLYTGNTPQALAVGDFNGDGNLDVAVSGSGDPEWGYAGVDVILGSGNGYFVTPMYGPIPIAGDYAPDIVAADFNRDGMADLAWTAVTAIEVALSNGDGTFQPAQNYALDFYAFSVAVADLNGDGMLDLRAQNESSGNVSILLGNGDGTFEDTSPPSLRINDVTVVEGNTGAVAGTFVVILSKASTETVTVAYATANGTATAGSDYQAASDTLTFAPGETSKTITVPVNGDRLGEPNETFVVNLSSPTNATIADGQGVGTIVDDEPRISINDVSKKEGRRNTTLFTFTVTLSAVYDQAVTMSFRTVNGSATTSDGDYVAKSGTLTFAPGETTKTITIEVKADSNKEANETFYLDLFGNSLNSLFTKSRGVGTILNDD